MVHDDWYPAWLAHDLLEGTFPWELSYSTTMPRFLDHYTLHDSSWITFVACNEKETGIAAISLDAYWNKVPYQTEALAKWPILLIRFDRLYGIPYSIRRDCTLSGATSQIVKEDEREKMLQSARAFSNADVIDYLSDENLHRTVIDDLFGSIEVLHGQEIHVLCLNSNREILPLPALENNAK